MTGYEKSPDDERRAPRSVPAEARFVAWVVAIGVGGLIASVLLTGEPILGGLEYALFAAIAFYVVIGVLLIAGIIYVVVQIAKGNKERAAREREAYAPREREINRYR